MRRKVYSVQRPPLARRVSCEGEIPAARARARKSPRRCVQLSLKGRVPRAGTLSRAQARRLSA